MSSMLLCMLGSFAEEEHGEGEDVKSQKEEAVGGCNSVAGVLAAMREAPAFIPSAP